MKSVKSLECPICYQLYDREERMPLQLPCCQHHICWRCARQLSCRLCPSCPGLNHKFEPWQCAPVPWILEVIEELRGLGVVGEDPDPELERIFGGNLARAKRYDCFRHIYKLDHGGGFRSYHRLQDAEFQKLKEMVKEDKLPSRTLCMAGRTSSMVVGVSVPESLSKREIEKILQSWYYANMMCQCQFELAELRGGNFRSVMDAMQVAENEGRGLVRLIRLPKAFSEKLFFGPMFGKRRYVQLTGTLLLVFNYQLPRWVEYFSVVRVVQLIVVFALVVIYTFMSGRPERVADIFAFVIMGYVFFGVAVLASYALLCEFLGFFAFNVTTPPPVAITQKK
jgi:hypothetical protein